MKKKVLVICSIATATILAGGWALAQPAGHGPGGFGPGGMQGMHGPMGQGMHGQIGPGIRGQMGPGMHGGPGLANFDPARIDTLKSELGITTAQEPAWIKYTKAIQDAATAGKATREGVNPENLGKLSPTDRFAFMTKMREHMRKQFETVQTAASELLAILDDSQKAKAQEISLGSHSLPAKCMARARAAPGISSINAGPRCGFLNRRTRRRRVLWCL